MEKYKKPLLFLAMELAVSATCSYLLIRLLKPSIPVYEIMVGYGLIVAPIVTIFSLFRSFIEKQPILIVQEPTTFPHNSAGYETRNDEYV